MRMTYDLGAIAELDEAQVSFGSVNTTCKSSDNFLSPREKAGRTTKAVNNANDKRYHVFLEMLETEENYLKVLNTLENVFRKPLEATKEEFLGKKEIDMIFSKVKAISKAHSVVLSNLRSLKDGWDDHSQVGKVWMKVASDLSAVYPHYINNYDDALKTLESCTDRPKFAAFLRDAALKPECQKNTLKDMLIRPVQRIPSVLLLLQELLKRTNVKSRDLKFLKKAIAQIKKVLEKTNESRRQSENHFRFLEICNDIEGFPAELVNSERDFIQLIDAVVLEAGGTLGAFKDRKIGIFLFNDMFAFAKKRGNSSNMMNATITGTMNASTITRSNTLSRQFSFSSFRRKQNKHYRYIFVSTFASVRSLEVIREYGIFVIKIRDEQADELCVFQLANGYTVDMGMELFEQFLSKNYAGDTSTLSMEDLTEVAIEKKYGKHPEEHAIIQKALEEARVVASPSPARRLSVSSGIVNRLQRFKSVHF